MVVGLLVVGCWLSVGCCFIGCASLVGLVGLGWLGWVGCCWFVVGSWLLGWAGYVVLVWLGSLLWFCVLYTGTMFVIRVYR